MLLNYIKIRICVKNYLRREALSRPESAVHFGCGLCGLETPLERLPVFGLLLLHQ